MKFMSIVGIFAARGISAFGVILLTALLNNTLGLAGAGVFFQAFILLNFLSIFCRFGLDFHLLRELSWTNTLSEKANIYIRIISLCFVISMSITVVLFTAWILYGMPKTPIFLIWTCLIPITLLNICASYIRASDKPIKGALIEATMVSAISIPVILGYNTKSNLNSEIVWFLYSGIAWMYFSLIAVITISKALSDGGKYTCVDLNYLAKSTKIGIATILTYVSQWGGVLLIGFLMPISAVGVLNGLLRLISPFQFFALTMDAYLAPKFANEAHKGNIITIKTLRRTGAIVTTSLGIIYGSIILFFPELTSNQLFGTSSSNYQLEILFLVFSNLLFLLLGSNGQILLAFRRDDEALYGAIFRSLISLALLIVLTPIIGIIGACISYVISMGFMVIFYRKNANEAMIIKYNRV